MVHQVRRLRLFQRLLRLRLLRPQLRAELLEPVFLKRRRVGRERRD